MGTIALREYHRKIENLIENHQIDQALAHCLTILNAFSKDIETYRKAGKLFLEKPDYTIAKKFFECILSVYPDDFVANIGLSFIYEQQNNMDEAIQYMLMAFELQPANPSLQAELKRLYNKRDSVEPAKIRLTRGALIKMYTRSDLFEQAIAEINLGLYEKPSRIDYKIHLADMLWKSGQTIEAVETCVDVVSQIPYCWGVNIILDKAFHELNRGQSENHYHARLTELDPYYRYMLPTTPDVADIPDIAVQIEERTADTAGFDWYQFLESTWGKDTHPVEAISAGSDLNWTSILEDADKDLPITDTGGVLPDGNDAQEGELEMQNKRMNFIERLQRRSAQQEQIPQPDSIEWLNEGDLDAAASKVGYSQSEPDAENLSEAEALLPEEDLINQSELQVDPALEEESPIIDQDVPPAFESEAEIKPFSKEWQKIDEALPAETGINASLKDTQQINILRESPENMLLQADKAIEGGNYQFALKTLHQLGEDETQLENLRVLLESACEHHPQIASLWLALGELYQRMDMKEKALEVFIRAQRQISL